MLEGVRAGVGRGVVPRLEGEELEEAIIVLRRIWIERRDHRRYMPLRNTYRYLSVSTSIYINW